MAFPVIAGSAVTNGTTAATSCVVNLPSGVQGGDLLWCVFRTASGTTASFPAGWTASPNNNTVDASDDVTTVAYRYSPGGEFSTITVTTDSLQKFAAVCLRIQGAEDPAVQAPQFGAVATGTSVNPNANTTNPTGGAKDYLWVSVAVCEGEQATTPTVPTSYAGLLAADSGTAGVVATNVRVFLASRSVNAASDVGDNWTISVSDDWSAWTFAFHPRSDRIPYINPMPPLIAQ